MISSEFTRIYTRGERKRAVLVVNPKSGGARAPGMIAPTVQALSNAGFETLAFTTTCGGDATRIAEDYAAEADLFVCSGGDGTINEVIRGVMKSDKAERPVLGFLPMGSTNDFATALGLARRHDKMIETLVSGVPTEIDVGCFNGRHYAYLASFGAFTDLSASTSQEAKNMFGFLAYLGNGMKSIANIRPIHTTVLVEGELITGDYAFVSVSNTPSVAGVINYNKKNHIDLNDGLFEVMLIDYPRNAIELSRIANALSTGDFDCEYMMRFSASEVRFVLDEPVDWILDGEQAEAGHEVLIQNVHSAVRVMLPKPEKKSVFGAHEE